MPLAGLENVTGSSVYVAVGEPTAETAAAYKTLFASAEEIVGLVEFGEWGDTENDVAEGLVSEGRIYHTNGASDGGEVTITIQQRDTDAGRDIITANSGGNTLLTFFKVYSDSGDYECASGVCTSPRYRALTQDSIRGQMCTARINTAVLPITAAAWAAA
ncbi:hypothetical protein ACRARG_04540 [Pseudooceanicola sp. C21-150M6]|uniref:hypothetical protein n=1 Tax=Pseudooceanicola sp. C21-150M6 TaxID=3434355 RepID=UPI003D7F94DC